MTTAIFIPARMASTRLPGKPLALIQGKPMILHVVERAVAAHIGSVYVACAEEEIAEVVTKAGAEAVLTDPNHPSGTDRIFEALTKVDKAKHFTRIVNLQGDLPTLDPNLVRQVVQALDRPEVDISTLVAEIDNEADKTSPHVVKAVFAPKTGTRQGRALYFTRATAPYGEGALYHHIGIYGFTRQALERFVSLPPSPLEQREKLEQLRALENNMHIEAVIVDTVPLGVDTPADLAKAENILGDKVRP